MVDDGSNKVKKILAFCFLIIGQLKVQQSSV